jgi:hypothetical protein
VIINPTPNNLASMWKRAQATDRNMIVLGEGPGIGAFAGRVTGHGSLYGVYDFTSGTSYDIRPEWIYSATLVLKRRGGE